MGIEKEKHPDMHLHKNAEQNKRYKASSMCICGKKQLWPGSSYGASAYGSS
jgi:hypothetical protein